MRRRQFPQGLLLALGVVATGLVLLLTVFHGLLERWRRDFAAGRNAHRARFYRIVNELPTLAMVAIVILVVVKPF